MDDSLKKIVERLKRDSAACFLYMDTGMKCNCNGRQFTDTPVCKNCLGTGFSVSFMSIEMLRELLKE